MQPRRQANRVNGRLAVRFDHDARTTDRHSLPRATVPRGERRHVPRPPPAHRLRHRHRAAAPRSHRRRPARPADGACATPDSSSSRPAPRAERRCSRSRTTLRNCSNATSTRRAGDPVALPLRDRHGPRRHLPARHPDHRALGQLRAASALGRHPRHAPARDRTRDRRTRPRTRRRVADSRAAHRVHGEALQHRHPQPEAVDRGVPPVPRPVVPSPPDGESTPTLDLPTVPLAHRLDNQRPRGRPLTAATREPTCQDCSYDPMIDPMATGTVQTTVRGPAPPPRAGGSFGPPSHPC